jgi:putative flippase GtrA
MTASSRLWSTSQRATFLRFAAVAVTIAVIDVLVLYLLHGGLGINVYLARAVSYSSAVFAGYFLNQHFTFHHHERTRSILMELSRFYTVFAGGGLVNYATFAAIIALGNAASSDPTLRFWLPLLGVWIGGLAGMGFNYGFARKLVFHNR